ncbi:hypothetical protein FHX44_113481 [Pseudonocardia hierapolitana]|uniref:Uncharacterized protein n=1 Tax=Pseudonocardia hierapolitana TaxID=1128676 RepID=A0A561SRU6_9PSEU|nr:hypothetical protein [Pseudonocardia hierapolitana]TWF77569.1 hypothetical protein FHX44_113481 [Pseudonocardia hierapolitana]
MPDRYADAVLARRRELRELRERLAGGHRGELRSCLALSRLSAARDASASLAGLRREAAEHVRRGDRAARDRLPEHVTAAVGTIAAATAARWAAELGPPLRRIATERGLALEPGRPRMPAPRPPGPPPPPGPATPDRTLLAGMVDAAALGRLALLPLAALPLAGLPALGGPALAPLAVGVGLTALVVAARARRTAAERDRLQRRVEQIIGAAAAAIEADLDRRLVELELDASAALDAAVLRRRAAVDRELASLAPDRAGSRG